MILKAVNKWRITSFVYPKQYLVMIAGQPLRTSDGSDGQEGKFTADEAPKDEVSVGKSIISPNLKFLF